MATIEEVYALAPEQMIFDTMDGYNPRWKGVYANDQLNLLYLNHAGSRPVSPMVKRLLKGEENLDLEARIKIGSLLNIMYMKNWNFEWDSLFADYNPVENYNMVEDEHTDDVKSEQTVSDSESNTMNTETRNLTSTSNSSTAGDTLNKVYAYDSENATNDSSAHNNGTSTDTSTDTGTVGDSGSSDSSTDTRYNTNNDNDRHLDRHGNIGVKSSQQLITEEIELRKFRFFDLVFRDIDELLCSRIISVD